MGVVGCFRSASDSEIRALLERPERIGKVFGFPVETPRRDAGFLSRLLGRKPSEAAPVDDWSPEAEDEDFDVDKAWHGIHFLLCGDAKKGDPPLNFIQEGGRVVGDVDVGYGPARVFTSEETARIAEALEGITVETLKPRCDRLAFVKADIYPSIWDEPDDDCFGYVIEHYDLLKDFINRTRQAGKGIIVYFS